MFPTDDTITPETLLEMNVWYLSSTFNDDRFHVGEPAKGLTIHSRLKRNTVLRLPWVLPNHNIFHKASSSHKSTMSQAVYVDFIFDYRYRNYQNPKASNQTKKEVKNLCMYYAASIFERVKQEPSKKNIFNGNAVTFTKHHPLHETHCWRRRKTQAVPLLLGPRLPSTSKLGVSKVKITNDHLLI